MYERENAPRKSLADLIEEETDSESEESDEDDSKERVEPWNSFVCYPPKSKTYSTRSNPWIEESVRVIKLLIYGFLFVIVLVGSVIIKSAVLLATSQLREDRYLEHCSTNIGPSETTILTRNSLEARIIWTWALIFMFVVPECFAIVHALRYYFKKIPDMPKFYNLTILSLVEIIHTIGQSLFIFVVLPEIDVVQGASLFNCLCFFPGFFGLLSRNVKVKEKVKKRLLVMLLGDLIAFLVQAGGVFAIAFVDRDLNDPLIWIIPLALILTSCRWWSNYTSANSPIGFIRFLAKIKQDLCPYRDLYQGWIGVLRITVFLGSAVLISYLKGVDPKIFFESLVYNNTYVVTMLEVANTTKFSWWSSADSYLSDLVPVSRASYDISFDYSIPFFILLIQAVCAMLVYQMVKFSYKTQMQEFSFAVPISLVVPCTIGLLSTACFLRYIDPCIFRHNLPKYIFFLEPDYEQINYLTSWRTWLWASLWISQIWITLQVWTGENKKLAHVRKIFFAPTYDSLIVDQSLSLNRCKHDEDDLGNDEADEEKETALSDNVKSTIRRKDYTTRVLACATMWHEEKAEIWELVGSILRLDRDQCSTSVMENFYKIRTSNYYELETHIFFDDAFQCMHGCKKACTHEENETQVNSYVKSFMEIVEQAIVNNGLLYKPPVKYPTPYGGRLVWTLPGDTVMTVHLKDKNKIRHRKRWSQVMYMYYLLGYRLKAQPIDLKRINVIAENTYILTLDGDIDFNPSAVKVLLDLMKANKELGAACGRVHPVGTGPMIWFQKFEYAIGHWLQKSTEHIIGCVLCSPGCFSMFRAKALMQPNVMAKYATESTEPRHYVQYDQGEDRWLCTLLIQIGCRVEYSAASDAYTHAPESFNDFYIQRRRWIPSTVANILDLLSTARETRQKNNDITIPYILYQWVLMGSTILGPGTIFLMLVGAFVSTFHIDNWSSFMYNLIPIGIFVGFCIFFKERIQLIVAAIISGIYGLIMIIVLVGIMLQITEDGWYAPSSLLFFVVALQLLAAGLIHPQEWTCLFCSIIYYITVPSMYLVLTIFSVFNVNNVTWGTRESKTAPAQQEEQQPLRNTEKAKDGLINIDKLRRRGGNSSLEFSFAGLFKCFFCVNDTPTKEEIRLDEIHESLLRINSRLDVLDRHASEEGEPLLRHQEASIPPHLQESYPNENFGEKSEKDVEEIYGSKMSHVHKSSDTQSEAKTQLSVASQRNRASFLVSPCWLQDDSMKIGEVDFLTNNEEEFWKNLIKEHLEPIDEAANAEKKQELTKQLIHLRDGYVIKFFMLNALFVLTVFLMQLNKDTLHFPWPLGMKYIITYSNLEKEVYIERIYLQLEPIGCLFVAGFILILSIQFLAMLVHRFDTFSHLLANTTLWCNKKAIQSEKEIFELHAKQIAEGLQCATDDVDFLHQPDVVDISKRQKTLRDLTEDIEKPRRTVRNLKSVFRQKLKESERTGFSDLVPKKLPNRVSTVFNKQRASIMEKRKQSQLKKVDPYDVYDNGDNFNRRLSSNHSGVFNSALRNTNQRPLGFDNRGFIPEEGDAALTE